MPSISLYQDDYRHNSDDDDDDDNNAAENDVDDGVMANGGNDNAQLS